MKSILKEIKNLFFLFIKKVYQFIYLLFIYSFIFDE